MSSSIIIIAIKVMGCFGCGRLVDAKIMLFLLVRIRRLLSVMANLI